MEAQARAQRRSALITGITGQDGSYLAELLLEQGYEVYGLARAPQRTLGCSEHLRERLQLVGGDLLDHESLSAAVASSRPREIYHLAAPSFVPDSWVKPAGSLAAIAGSTAALLEAVRDLDSGIRVFVASSAAMFGDAPHSPQHELTPCRPANPYAAAKLLAHQLTGLLRAHDGLYACSGILFNHESPRRPEQFVTRRVTRAAAAIARGERDELTLGDLDAVRDWSFAGDVMRGAWMMLQQDEPDDYVLASGVARTVRELVQTAFACVGLDPERYLRVEPTLVRAREATVSVGDPSKAHSKLGWQPEVDFRELIQRMVKADMQAAEQPRA
jgi:GDPmannose 4,6-dehydratase